MSMGVPDCLGGSPSLLFVYGTLQRGESDYPWWLAHPQHAVFVAVARTQKRYPLFVNFLSGDQGSAPCMLNLPRGDDPPADSGAGGRAAHSLAHHVVGELFMITATMKKWLDVLEDVKGGLHTVGTIDVIPTNCEHNVLKSLCAREGEAVRALVYFRKKDYPEDWNSPSPTCSSGLLARFSSLECLKAYGRRFCCLPAHLRVPEDLERGLEGVGHVRHGTPRGTPFSSNPIVLFIIDGIGDTTYPSLGGRTPLEVVAGVPSRCEIDKKFDENYDNTKFDQFLAPGINVVTTNGVSGTMDVFEAGVACGSDTAHLSIFGYPPQEYYRGRGAYEAIGAGLPLAEGDIAFKSNFSVMDEATGIVTQRRCDRNFTVEGPLLCEFLDGKTVYVEVDRSNLGDESGNEAHKPVAHSLKVRYATEHRCGVALTGEGLSHKITGTDPLADGRPLLYCKPTVPPEHEDYNAALYTSRVVNAASKRMNELLRNHPINEARRAEGKKAANVVLLRGAANKGWVPPFVVRHSLVGFIVSPTCIIKGLGACCGLDPIDVEGATGDWHTNVDAKVDAVLRTLGINGAWTHNHETSANTADGSSGGAAASPYNFAVLHVKGVDDAGHERSLEQKLRMLKKCGDAMQKLWDGLPTGSTMVVLADHSTPLSIGDHSCEPVPVSVATKGSGITDAVQFYSEVECADGVLGRFCGESLMETVKRMHHWYHYR
uniref:Uncharacterized protein TCIL3000_11_12090 n=1 Tax=Trypanosoma congolense (strain IL3000) TaxID=1068625 RepID=G0V244_TRYCI|nr:unnamed protein product [Trypanosoma congolense IL3000]